MRSGRRWVRWVVWSVVGVLVLAIVGDLIISAVNDDNSKPPTVDSPQVPSDPGSPSKDPNDPAQDEAGVGSVSVTNKQKSGDAVNAAVQATSAVSVGFFLPENLFVQTLKTTVAPESHNQFLLAFRGDPSRNTPGVGQSLATVWNYSTVGDALLNAEYRVTTQKYRVDKFDPSAGTAVVYLYTLTHFNRRLVTEENAVLLESFFTPTINVVNMRYENGRWLYVSSPPTPANRQPKITETGLSLKEIEARYAPYVKEGYLDYQG